MRIVLVLCVLLTAAGCSRGRAAAAELISPGGPPTPQPLAAAATLYYDNSGGIQDSMRVVIRDEATLADYWARATAVQPFPPTLPAVDFGSEMVVVASAGRMSPADVIRVDSAAIRYEVSAPGARQRVLEVIVRTIRGCQPFNTDAYPVVFVRVPRLDGPVRFTERSEREQGCAAAAGPEPAGEHRIGFG